MPMDRTGPASDEPGRGDELGRVGIWPTLFNEMSAGEARDVAGELEELGYGTVWVPEGPGGREVFVAAGLLLSATTRVRVASAIACISWRLPFAAVAAARTLHAAHQGRFVLGLGVGHARFLERHGIDVTRPVERMRDYLDAMDAAPWRVGGEPPGQPLRFLAALGPRMVDLAAERTDGALPNCVPVAHTVAARRALGHKLLAPSQFVVLETDPDLARATARKALATYLALPNYRQNLRRWGFAEEDLDGGGSTALVDAIVAWGDEERVAARVQEHLDAGADHVCLHVYPTEDGRVPREEWRRLAPALAALRVA